MYSDNISIFATSAFCIGRMVMYRIYLAVCVRSKHACAYKSKVRLKKINEAVINQRSCNIT